VRQERAAFNPITVTAADISDVLRATRTDSPSPEMDMQSPTATPPTLAPDEWATQMPTLAIQLDEPTELLPAEIAEQSLQSPPLVVAQPEPHKFEISDAQKATLKERIMRGVAALHDEMLSQLSWNEEGRSYTAMLTRKPVADSMGLERIVAEVTMSDAAGVTLQTLVTMQRLAFSQFTQVVDYWDPEVQLHDDVIVGRFHSNSPVNIVSDAQATPKFLGRVTTAGRGFRVTADSMGRGSNARSGLFQGGLETNTGRIDFPTLVRPLTSTPFDENSHLLAFTEDAHITFHQDGSYAWQTHGSDVSRQSSYATDHPVYLIASPGVTLHVKGKVNGRVLVYSPENIVIEGNLVYAHDPRARDADDYLGLVSGKYVKVAPHGVIGPGNLEINAAIFARRRFIVTDIDYGRTAKLFIYGSLTTGTLSATEPRYTTRIEFDPRLEHLRPPGFPTTDRYEVADWEGKWNEIVP
jgi:hypothetical protein